MHAPIGTYTPPQTQALSRATGPYLIWPMADKDGGMANAHYTYERLSDDYRAIYTLTYIDEWLPPMSPQEKALMFTDQWALPPTDENGRTDYKALAERRRKEWAEARA